MRTSLALLVSGLAIAASPTVTDAPRWLAALGIPLVAFAGVVAVAARRRFYATQAAIERGEPVALPGVAAMLPWGIAAVAGIALVVAAVALASA